MPSVSYCIGDSAANHVGRRDAAFPGQGHRFARVSCGSFFEGRGATSSKQLEAAQHLADDFKLAEREFERFAEAKLLLRAL